MNNVVKGLILALILVVCVAFPAAAAVPGYKIPWMIFTYGIPAYAVIMVIIGLMSSK